MFKACVSVKPNTFFAELVSFVKKFRPIH